MNAAVAPKLTRADFERFRRLVQDESGICLADHKQALFVGRLSKRLKALQLESFTDYYRAVTDGDELTTMLDCLCTHETHFFREPKHFELLRSRIIPEWEAAADAGRRQRRLRIWSAACSSGEEPYSIAMSLLDHFAGREGWSFDLLASDLSTRVLDRARAAEWSVERAEEIPKPLLRRFMLRGVGSQLGRMRGTAELQNAVKFTRINLCSPPYPAGGAFDAIFCRNALIYFDAPTKARVVDALTKMLVPGGYLFLGHSEGLLGTRGASLQLVQPTVYVRA